LATTGPTTPKSIEKKQSQKGGVEAPFLLVMTGLVVFRSRGKRRKKKGVEVPPLLVMASLIAFRSIRKNKKKKKKGGTKAPFLLVTEVLL
jgi:hypothetical protein